MGLGRLILVAVIAAALGGCVTASNTLSVDEVSSLRYAGVNVSFAPDAHIWWGDGERAYAASKGQPAASDELAKTPEGRAYLRNSIAAKVKAAMDRNLAGALGGTRPVRADVRIKAVTITSTVQRVILGGHHQMVADVTLVDARTGAVLLPHEAQTKVTNAGQGVAALVDNAIMGDPMDRVVNDYANQYTGWLTRRGGTPWPG
jgi:hypothetical protein